jgi:hypothetical protein
MRAALELFFSFQDASCRLFTTQGREYDSGLGGVISLIVDAEADERYSLNLSHNTSTGKRTQSALGYWPHGKVPLGFVAVEAPDNPNRKVLEPSDAADVIREAFRLYDEEHASLRDVHRYLATSLGKDFDRTFPRVLLSNPAYIGKVKCDSERFDGRHQALVSEDRFERITQRLAQASVEHHRPPKKWPFARIARCGECGSTLRFRKLKQRYTYLFCTNPNFPHKECDQSGIPAGLFEANFTFYLGAIAHGLRLRLAADPLFAIPEASGGDLMAARNVLAESRDRLSTATSLVLDGSLTRDDRRYKQAKIEKDAAEAAVQRLSSQARSYREELESFVESVEAMAHVPPQIERWIQREYPAAYSVESRTDLLGDRFVQRVIFGWENASLAVQRSVVAQTFERIEVGTETLTLHFRTALPCPLVLPALFNTNDRADVESENFGDFEQRSVSPIRTAPR